MPFLYEYFGVKELKEKQIIGDDIVAIPGHPGDFLRGDHLSLEMLENNPEFLVSQILSKFGTSYPVNSDEKRWIKKYITENYLKGNENQLWKGYERWDYKERQCKFIGNSSQVFSFFEIDYLMPLFDKACLNFFGKVPFEQKVTRKLYNRTLENYFFQPLGVDFDIKPNYAHENRFNDIKQLLLNVLPGLVKKWYYPLNDDIYYREITHELQNSKPFHYKTPVRPNAYNAYIIQWYLQLLKP
jgi:asparagine synthase (glutamine-hydrolysing)